MKREEFKRELKETQKGHNIDDVVDTYVFEPLALLCSKVFIKLHIKPNAITIISAIIGMTGGYFLSYQRVCYRLIGILLILISGIFDCADGIVARKTKTFSPIGRNLDGFCDGLICISLYLGIGFRLMNSYVPFFRVKWGIWIWPVLLFTGYLHLRQMTMADYFRNLHLFFANTDKRNELDRAHNIKIEGNFITRFFKRIYKWYTSSQERITPFTQELLFKIEGKEDISDIRSYYALESEKTVRKCNWLTYNFRTLTFFVLTIFGLDSFIFILNLFILEPIFIFVVSKYETIAKKALEITNK